MKQHQLRAGAIALAFAIFLSVSPIAEAAGRRDEGFTIRERIVRFLDKLQERFAGIASFDDFPLPPRP